MRTTVIKRRFTNIQTLTAKPRKASEAADGRVKIAATATKRALLPRATGLTKTVWSNRRWRRALANYYLKAPPATTCTAPPESTPHNGAITAEEKRRSTEDESAGDDTFYTFDNAPTVDRFGLPFNLAVVWASKLPGGLERLSCIMMAIFLFLAILSVQLYVGTLSKHRIRSRLSLLCSKPSSLEEVITFECRVTLLLLAWILSVLLAWLVLLCHFLFWCCTFRRPRSSEELFEEGDHGKDRQSQQESSDQQSSNLLDEIVTEESISGDKKED